MADETKVEAKAAAEAPAKVAEAVADTVETVVKRAPRSPSATARQDRSPRQARSGCPEGGAKTARRTTRKTRTAARKTAPKAARAAQKRIETMTNSNFFNGFDAVPAFAPFQTMFADANERSQELAKRGQKVAEELADLARANVEAVVEAGRVAAEGARSIGQEVVATQP